MSLVRRQYRVASLSDSSIMNPNCSPRSSFSDSLFFHKNLNDLYHVARELGSGTYGKVMFAQCKRTGTEVALKILPKVTTKLKDFLREFNYGYYLSPHRSIISTFDVAFETSISYVFAQEYAPFGDLFDAINPQVGLPEHQAKHVARQISPTLEFIHSKDLVHRDVKPENILVFDENLTRVKLMDFGMTKRSGTQVRKVSKGIPYTPPEICDALKGERYSVEPSADVWAFGVLLFCMLTGNFPWEHAYHKDIFFHEFLLWQRRKISDAPLQWSKFTCRLMRLFRRLLEVRPERRCSIKEVQKFLEDDWVVTVYDEEEEEYSSNPMDELNNVLEKQGISTRLSKRLRERRISEWLTQSSS